LLAIVYRPEAVGPRIHGGCGLYLGSERIAPAPQRFFTANEVDALVAGHADEKVAQPSTLRIEGPGTAPEAEKGVLRDLLGQIRIVHDPFRHTEHHSSVGFDHLSQRLLVAGDQPVGKGGAGLEIHDENRR
jgi:hypothetical protein